MFAPCKQASVSLPAVVPVGVTATAARNGPCKPYEWPRSVRLALASKAAKRRFFRNFLLPIDGTITSISQKFGFLNWLQFNVVIRRAPENYKLFAHVINVPRFSLRLLFSLTMVAAATVAYLTRPSPQQRIQRMLSSHVPDAEKLRYVSRFAKLGDQETAVHARIGQPRTVCGGSVQHDCEYRECNLILWFRADGTLFRIGYNVRRNESVDCYFHLLDEWPLDPKANNKAMQPKPSISPFDLR